LIRLARPSDAEALRELAMMCIANGIPATREASSDEVVDYCRRSYEGLADQLRVQRDFVVLVEEHEGVITGYLMLDFGHVEPSTGERQCYIVDLGVHPEKRGRFATHRLIKKAAQLARARGLKYLVGTVSSNNDRTLQLGLKSLGFEVERVQIMKRC